MTKRKKIKLLIVGLLLLAVLSGVAVVWAVNSADRKKIEEIDQKFLFLYLYDNTQKREIDAYYIDKYGNKVEAEFAHPLLYAGSGQQKAEVLCNVPEEEKQTTPHQFSPHQIVKLYSYISKMNSEYERQRTLKYGIGVHYLVAFRSREDGTTEEILFYVDGFDYWESPDPYAQKIKEILLRKNPIQVEFDRKFYFDS